MYGWTVGSKDVRERGNEGKQSRCIGLEELVNGRMYA